MSQREDCVMESEIGSVPPDGQRGLDEMADTPEVENDEVAETQKEDADEKKRKAKRPSAPKCDLCNETLHEEEEVHQQCHHGTFHRWCDILLSKRKNEVLMLNMSSEHVAALGTFVVESVVGFDKGREAFKVIQRASQQLNDIFECLLPGTQVFLFGSCVASGSWDGAGDADFTVLQPQRLSEGDWPPPDEAKFILGISRKLCMAGFLFKELEPVLRTRVPVVKRVQEVRAPLRIPVDGDTYKIVYSYNQESAARDVDELVNRLRANGAEVRRTQAGKLTACFKSASEALHQFSKNERRDPLIVAKAWKPYQPLPEIFSIDFDISCRPFGVRNSWFMRQYLSQRHEVRAGCAFLKRWSKQYGINNPVKGYLTSYAVMNLWLCFLLHIGFVKYVDPASVPLEPCSEWLQVPYLPLLRDDNDVSVDAVSQCSGLEATRGVLGDLVAKFFRFYVDFEWCENVVTLRNPDGLTSCASLGWIEENELRTGKLRDRVWYRMCIEDPYEDKLNLGRHISPHKFAFVRAQFVRGLEMVLRGHPERLFLDERRLAMDTLPALLHRALYEEGLAAMSLTEAREFLISRAGEAVLGGYEVHHTLGSLCDMMTVIRKNNEKAGGDAGEDGNNSAAAVVADAERPPSPHSCMSATDEHLRTAGAFGIPAAKVPKGVRGAYFFACGRAFLTAEERAVAQQHAAAVLSALASGFSTRESVQAAVRCNLPTALRSDALVDALLVEKDGSVWAAAGVEEAPVRVVVRKKDAPRRYNKRADVRRAKQSGSGTCTQCGKPNTTVWGTDQPRVDSGMYCNACWCIYERPR